MSGKRVQKPTGKVYRIATFDDFLKVPAERLDRCLREAMIAISAACGTAQAIEAVSVNLGNPPGAINFKFPAFEWTDDDERTLTLRVLAPGESDDDEPAVDPSSAPATASEGETP